MPKGAIMLESERTTVVITGWKTDARATEKLLDAIAGVIEGRRLAVPLAAHHLAGEILTALFRDGVREELTWVIDTMQSV
jgi:hypothetical protein